MSGHRQVFRVLIWTIICTCLIAEILGQSRSHPNGRGTRRRNRNRGGHGTLPPDVQQMYLSAAGRGNPVMPTATPTEVQTSSMWHRFAPRLPAPNEIECHVEVMTIRRQGGRCTRLGGSRQRTICQSGRNVEFNPQCDSVIQEREEREAAAMP